jgi:hypothetical protein
MEPDENGRNVFFPKTLAEAIEALESVVIFEKENPDKKGQHSVIATNHLFLDLFRRIERLEMALLTEIEAEAQWKAYWGE